MLTCMVRSDAGLMPTNLLKTAPSACLEEKLSEEELQEKPPPQLWLGPSSVTGVSTGSEQKPPQGLGAQNVFIRKLPERVHAGPRQASWKICGIEFNQGHAHFFGVLLLKS